MPNLNPHTRAESLRPKSDREQMLARIAADCGAAWLALKAGDQHPRHKTMAERTINRWTRKFAEEAALYPKLPEIIVTVPVDPSKGYGDYLTRRYGLGGSELQE
ncbi:hypothetical protein [Erwinia sp. E_sp_B04_7]|uniref:hypothetical protein n=1 Tax=unclassified Erwinia TaxID=2622719 RepID=UPI0030CA8A50